MIVEVTNPRIWYFGTANPKHQKTAIWAPLTLNPKIWYLDATHPKP